MAFRILEHGVVECDTIEELRQLQRRPLERRPPSSPRRSKKIDSELPDRARALVIALVRSADGILNTEEAAAALNIPAKSLPPQVRLVVKWCREHKLDFDALVERKTAYVNRKPQTVYRLTAEGRQHFGKFADAASMNGTGANMHTG